MKLLLVGLLFSQEAGMGSSDSGAVVVVGDGGVGVDGDDDGGGDHLLPP